MTSFSVWLFLSAALLCGAQGVSRQPFTLEQAMKAPFASNLTVAPGGQRVAWVVNVQGRRNLWIAESPRWSGQQATKFEEDDGQEIDELAWSRDGGTLLFARGSDFETDKENPNPLAELKPPVRTIWAVTVQSRAVTKLGDGRAPSASSADNRVWFLRLGQVYSMRLDGADSRSEFQVEGTASELTWSPDGRQLAFTNNRGTHSFISLYTAGENRLRFLEPSVDSDFSPVWSLDGKRIAFVRQPATTLRPIFGARREGYAWSIHVADAATAQGKEVFRAEPGKGSVFHEVVAERQLFWTAAGQLVFPWEKTGWLHLYRVNEGGGAPKDLTPGGGEVEYVSSDPQQRSVTFSSNIRDIDRRHLWSVHPDSDEPAVQLTRGESNEWAPYSVAGGVAFLSSTFNKPSHAEMLAAGSGARDLAPDVLPVDFPAASFVKPEPVIFASADGLQIHGQLFLPAGGGKHPALVFFHGGSRRQMLLGFHYMYYYANAYTMNQFLANRGYVVLSVNYRSGIGYGLNFREALRYGATGASEYADVKAAGVYLQSRSDVDSKRIGSWGGSYGGYLTALALARDSQLFAAGVDFHGVHDWNVEFDGEKVPGDVRARENFEHVSFTSSPLASVSTWTSPVLLIHGDDDRNVPFSETIQLVESLRSRDVHVEQLIFPNEIHDLLLWGDWLTSYRTASNFFDRMLRSN